MQNVISENLGHHLPVTFSTISTIRCAVHTLDYLLTTNHTRDDPLHRWLSPWNKISEQWNHRVTQKQPNHDITMSSIDPSLPLLDSRRSNSLSLSTSPFSSRISRAFGSSLTTALQTICLARSAYLNNGTMNTSKDTMNPTKQVPVNINYMEVDGKPSMGMPLPVQWVHHVTRNGHYLCSTRSHSGHFTESSLCASRITPALIPHTGKTNLQWAPGVYRPHLFVQCSYTVDWQDRHHNWMAYCLLCIYRWAENKKHN